MSYETTRTPTWGEVIANAIDANNQDLRVALPCQVQTYYLNTQTVDVQPVLLRPYVDALGNEGAEARPVLSNVQVQFPSGGGMIFTFPLVPGDTGLLVFSDQSLDIWKSVGGSGINPIDLRTHNITDAVFLPGVLPTSAPRKSASGQYVTVGKDGVAPDFAALAAKVLTQLNAIATTFNNHTHLYIPGTAAAVVTAPPASSMSPASVASASLQILG